MSERAGIDRANATLVLLGVNHHTAPVEVRERLAIPAGGLAAATRSLAAAPGICEGLILSTCNRVELITMQESGGPRAADLRGFLHEYFRVTPATLEPHVYEFREREAVRHLFRVASSLDSMVVGEPQILGQVKESYTVAREVGAISGAASGREGVETGADGGSQGRAGASGGYLDLLLQRAFTVAKKVRSETQIGSSSVSIASVAVDLARKIFGSLAGKTVLLVGAGKMSELAVWHLMEHGATSILVANRTRARAEKIVAQFAGERQGRSKAEELTTGLIGFEDLGAEAYRADIVITSTGAAQQLFGPAQGVQFIQRRRGRPMFFIDIAVPRDIDPRLNEVDGCFVYDIDDLQQVAQANLADRTREAMAAESIVLSEVERFQQRLQALDAVPAIKALQMHAEGLREAELQRVAKSLATLTAEQRVAVDGLTRSLTAKFLHAQLTAIRGAAEVGDAAELARLEALYRGRKER